MIPKILLTRGDENEGGTSIDDTSSRRQNSSTVVRDRLVDAPEFGRREGRREWNIVYQACHHRVVIVTERELPVTLRLGSWGKEDAQYFLRYPFLSVQIVHYSWDFERIANGTHG